MWAAFLADKSSVPESIKKIQAAAENKCGRKLRVFRTDSSGEFTSVSFIEYFADQGVEQHHYAPHSRTAWWSGAINRWWLWRMLC
jgi:hypothetical protein